MNKIVYKPFWNVEREQAWLNRMAANGYALTDYFWVRYVFERTGNAEYTYFIDFLEKPRRSIESEAYLEFLEDSGIEIVSTYFRWVYLRKKTADGPLLLYTDITSRISYLRRIRNFWIALTSLEAFCGLYNIIFFTWVEFSEADRPIFTVNIVCGILCLLLSLMFGFCCLYPILSGIRKLKREKALFD